MQVDRLDHLVLTVRDIAQSCGFYESALGMTRVEFAPGRWALAFGRQKLNLHPAERPFEPCADHAVPGSADLCFLTTTPIAEVAAHLAGLGVTVIEGPVPRIGAAGPLLSVYCRDPDGNLIEIANLMDSAG